MDLNRADFALLSSLNVLLEKRSVTAAADHMGISQPAMSARLARLREIFDDELLVGNAHGMVLTTEAEAIQPKLAVSLSELTQLVRERAPFDPLSSDRTFTIASTDYIMAASLMPALEDVMQQAPDIRIAAKSLTGTETSIADNDLVVTTPLTAENHAKTVTLFSETFVLATRRNLTDASKPISLDAFCEFNHILTSPHAPAFSGPVDGALEKLGGKRRVAMSLPSFLLVLDTVARSDLVAVLPKRLALAHADRLDIYDVPFDMRGFDVIATWHPRLQKDPGHVWLRTSLVNSMRSRTDKR